jgi:signal transduction histidine kinase
MHERAAIAAAEVTIDSQSGAGTRVRVGAPLAAPDPVAT